MDINPRRNLRTWALVMFIVTLSLFSKSVNTELQLLSESGSVRSLSLRPRIGGPIFLIREFTVHRPLIRGDEGGEFLECIELFGERLGERLGEWLGEWLGERLGERLGE